MGQFLAKVSLLREQKKVTEQYLVDAVSCTDAETLVYNELSVSEELKVVSVSESNYDNVVCNDEAETFFAAKVSYITENEITGTEKRENANVLIQSDSFGNAYNTLLEQYKNSMADYVIKSVSETKILGYIKQD